MPEIIQFSNNLCYLSEPLIPLRQYGIDRIVPVINTVHVKDGYLTGDNHHINKPEAELIVEHIQKCCKDPKYKEKTIGVISLLGYHQAKYIESLLLEKIDSQEFEKRQIVCGDAYAFQGDERDIMFLSMVIANQSGKSIHALTKQTDERRFNVAASRAKDQMWLFHSVTTNDLNPECVRYKLLHYCLNPQIPLLSIDNIKIEELKNISNSKNRNRMQIPSPFESWFEIDVFLKVYEHGYRVVPQFEVGGYRIDLVIEGMKGRLAVECDGDEWHGPEQYQYDMERQRRLERCDWTFWRIRGSSFYLNPDESLEGLWNELKQHDIHPIQNTPNSINNSNSQPVRMNSTLNITLNPEDESVKIKKQPPKQTVLPLLTFHNSGHHKKQSQIQTINLPFERNELNDYRLILKNRIITDRLNKDKIAAFLKLSVSQLEDILNLKLHIEQPKLFELYSGIRNNPHLFE